MTADNVIPGNSNTTCSRMYTELQSAKVGVNQWCQQGAGTIGSWGQCDGWWEMSREMTDLGVAKIGSKNPTFKLRLLHILNFFVVDSWLFTSAMKWGSGWLIRTHQITDLLHSNPICYHWSHLPQRWWATKLWTRRRYIDRSNCSAWNG